MAYRTKYENLPTGYILRRARPKNRCRRIRYGKLPRPAESATLHWGLNKPGLKGIRGAQIVRMLMEHPDFKDTVGVYLDKVDRRHITVTGSVIGKPRTWTSWDLEAILLYRRLEAKSTVKRAIIQLEARPKDRAALGLSGIPSLSTISKFHRWHSNSDEREAAYLELDRRLRDRVIQLPGFDEEARIMGMDGSAHETYYTPPPSKNYEGEFAGVITAPDAGYRGGRKKGKGFQLVSLFTERGTPLAWELRPINEGEKPIGTAVIESYAKHIMPKREKNTVSVCTCDGGFQSPRIHRALLDARVMPNIHKASHATEPKTLDSVKKRGSTWAPFYHPHEKHYSNWLISDLDEMVCKCMKGTTERVIEITPKGKLSVGTKGRCDECGTVTITAGLWRRAQNPKRVAFIAPEDRGERANHPSVGNPLHFYDPVAQVYGCDRFGWNESLHSVLQKRFGMLKKSWVRTAQDARIEFAIVFSSISLLLLKRDENLNGTAQQSAPKNPGQPKLAVKPAVPNSAVFVPSQAGARNVAATPTPNTQKIAVDREHPLGLLNIGFGIHRAPDH